MAIPEVWAGPECAYLQVGTTAWDQLRLTGHDRRAEDIDLLRRLGVRAARYPVLWGRSRSGDATDWTWADERIRALGDAGIKPIVGLLHHGFGPPGHDPRDPTWPRAFAQYAAAVARRLPAWAFLPVNEPLTTARFGGLYRLWPPYAADDGVFADLLLALIQGFRLAVREIRRIRPEALIVADEDCGRTDGVPSLRSVIEHYEHRRWLTFDLLTGRVDRHHPMWSALAGSRHRRRVLDELRAEPQAPDVLGIDYYVTSDRFVAPLTSPRTGEGRPFQDLELVRVEGGQVGFGTPIEEVWRRYELPLALTEVHMAGTPRDQVAWWAEAWSSAQAAVRRGIPVLGVTAWATFGAVDWSSLLCEPRGEYVAGCFDVASGRPTLTPLGSAVRRAARGRPIGGDPGWWRRPDRVTAWRSNAPLSGRPTQPADEREHRRAAGGQHTEQVGPMAVRVDRG